MKATFSKILSIFFLALYVLTFTSCDKSELVAPQDAPILKAFDGGDGEEDEGNANDGDITDDEDDDEDGKDITDDEDDDEDDDNKSFAAKAKLRK